MLIRKKGRKELNAYIKLLCAMKGRLYVLNYKVTTWKSYFQKHNGSCNIISSAWQEQSQDVQSASLHWAQVKK